MKTFETIHYKDMISNNDVVKLLEEVGFSEIRDGNEEVGYVLEYRSGLTISIQKIQIYLKRGYLNIHLTPAYLNIDIYKLDSQIFYYQGKLSKSRSWYSVKKVRYKKEELGMKDFMDFLLLSICRDSFLDPEEEADQIKMNKRHSGKEFFINEENLHDWYL